MKLEIPLMLIESLKWTFFRIGQVSGEAMPPDAEISIVVRAETVHRWHEQSEYL
jgi:hypothetical protein